MSIARIRDYFEFFMLVAANKYVAINDDSSGFGPEKILWFRGKHLKTIDASIQNLTGFETEIIFDEIFKIGEYYFFVPETLYLGFTDHVPDEEDVKRAIIIFGKTKSGVTEKVADYKRSQRVEKKKKRKKK